MSSLQSGQHALTGKKRMNTRLKSKKSSVLTSVEF